MKILGWKFMMLVNNFALDSETTFIQSKFTDAGRVYCPGEKSTKLNQSYGAGLWAYFIEPSYMVNITAANSSEELAFYISAGYAF